MRIVIAQVLLVVGVAGLVHAPRRVLGDEPDACALWGVGGGTSVARTAPTVRLDPPSDALLPDAAARPRARVVSEVLVARAPVAPARDRELLLALAPKTSPPPSR